MIDKNLARRVFSCIDNTTLNATDNTRSVESFCRRTMEMRLNDGTTVAAVCVYPLFVGIAKRTLQGSGIKVASVAGAFPHGQLPLDLRIAEVHRVVDEGADEVDIVINRGLLLAGDYEEMSHEIAEMERACSGRTLKVILETGELYTLLVRRAAQRAIDSGADFIKTSTGKISTGATLEAAEMMLNVVNENVKFNKKSIGFKAAGGIRTPEEALAYAEMAKKIVGDNYINNQTFRIGASRLTESLYSLLTF